MIEIEENKVSTGYLFRRTTPTGEITYFRKDAQNVSFTEDINLATPRTKKTCNKSKNYWARMWPPDHIFDIIEVIYVTIPTEDIKTT